MLRSTGGVVVRESFEEEMRLKSRIWMSLQNSVVEVVLMVMIGELMTLEVLLQNAE